MDKEYRKALKMHLMKAFAINKTEEKNQKTISQDLVQTLFATPSLVSKSRIIDALIDTPVQTARESNENYDSCTKYFQNKSKTTESQQNRTPTSPITPTKRMKGGDNTNAGCCDGPPNSQTNFSVFNFGSTNRSGRSQTPSFRKRTARELSEMVLAECELVESLNLIESERSQCNKTEQPILDLPIVLWRSKKKKFNSSVDLRFDGLPNDSSSYQDQSSTPSTQTPPTAFNHKNNYQNDQEEKFIDEDDFLDAEGIIREQFTKPLIRHVERNYVRNITATADLLKILERMPADIDRVLAKECSK